MPGYFAFLRAINVGGHTVKMDTLKQIFESMGFTHVGTFIASGNVAFETSTNEAFELEKTIEDRLKETLGFEVVTFLRTEKQVIEIAGFQPFSETALKTAVSVNVAFLKEPLDNNGVQKVKTLETPTDEFLVHGREVYWLVRTRQTESSFSNAVLEKTLGIRSTIRGLDTVRKMVYRFADGSSEKNHA